MKKLTRITTMLVAAMMLIVLLAGCAPGKNSSDTSEAGNAPAAETESPQDDTHGAEESPAADGTHIVPIASAFDPTKLEDCVFQVSFTNNDIELNDEGTFVLHLTIWDQELFDAVDVSLLKSGDTITVRGKDITVDSVERTENIVHINGGEEAGGVTLMPEESGGTFHESIAEVSEYDAIYTSVAQLALPVDGDNFIYTDNSDPDGKSEVYLAGDLLTMKDDVDFSCTAMNGTAHIVNNQVAEITRIYTP